MPPRASSRLTLYVLPGASGQTPAGDLLVALSGAELAEGGAGEVIAESFDRDRFIGNGQGGYRVRCPESGDSIVRPFAAALEAWRGGAPRTVNCPCGAVHALSALEFSPPAGFARQWLRAMGAQSLDVPAFAREILNLHWPGWTVVGSRG